MIKQRHTNILLTKSYSLCLLFALAGCIPATTPPFIDTPREPLTKTTSASHPVYSPIERKEPTSRSFPLPNYPNQLQHGSLMIQLYEFRADSEIEQGIATVNELPKGQSSSADSIYSIHQFRNSDSGPASLPNSGGGGGGGRRRIEQGML